MLITFNYKDGTQTVRFEDALTADCGEKSLSLIHILELGMLLAKIGRSKVAILLSQADKMERPSDIDGLIYIPVSYTHLCTAFQ